MLRLIGIAALLFITGYFIMPTMAWDNINLYFLLGLFVFPGITVLLIKTKNGDFKPTVPWGLFLCLSILTVIVAISIAFGASTLFHAKAYYDLIGEVKVKNFEDDVAPIDQSKIIIIDKQIAARLGDKTLVAGEGDENVVGSQVSIGDYVLQEVNGNLYYIAPTLHTNFWKYIRRKEGTPGYIMVNAINEKDIQYVEDYKIKYQPNACFSLNLNRHLYMNGYATEYLYHPEFEIDDNGHPYWVFSKYEKTIAVFGDQTTGCVVVNAETGDIKEYSIENAPEWIDRIQPRGIIKDQLHYWGELVEGWWNPYDLKKKRITDGIVMTYGQDNRCYFYTGVTSVGKDGASIGFLSIDSKTKDVTLYRKAGATEDRAMSSAEGAVQEKGYNASFPRTYNVNGIPTYIMALKDNEGLIKLVAMVSVENYETVAIGETVKEAMREYQTRLNTHFANLVVNEDMEENLIQTVVRRINQQLSSQMMYMSLDSLDKIITVDPEMYPEAVLTHPGDHVLVSIYDSEDATTSVYMFDNLDLHFFVSDEQVQLEYDLNNPKENRTTYEYVPVD